MVVQLPSMLIVTICLLSILGAAATELVLDGGTKGCSNNWSRSIDTVMGGKSSLTYRCDGNVLEAQGYLSIDGGGFAGVSRSLSETIDLGGGSYNGMEVTYEGLERTALPLALELRLGALGQRANFGSVFALLPSSEPGAVGRVTLPLDSFLPRNNFNSGGSGTLDVSRIGAIAYQLLFQEGDFLFRIVEVKAVSSPTTNMYIDPPNALLNPSPMEVIALIDGTIARGSFAYNQNYIRQCEKVYSASMRQLVDALTGICDTQINVNMALTDALSKVDALSDASDRAFALRDGLDEVRAITVELGDSWSSDGACATLVPPSVDKVDTVVDAVDTLLPSVDTVVDTIDTEPPSVDKVVDTVFDSVVDTVDTESSSSSNRHDLWSRMVATALLVAVFG
mmetsp:Transcript_15139/g.18420  ORF Transcript_15139/g.18420 Transcript_15139/m.18420 type:complete len:395 (-) Transcript_15139:231-1415(-)